MIFKSEEPREDPGADLGGDFGQDATPDGAPAEKPAGPRTINKKPIIIAASVVVLMIVFQFLIALQPADEAKQAAKDAAQPDPGVRAQVEAAQNPVLPDQFAEIPANYQEQAKAQAEQRVREAPPGGGVSLGGSTSGPGGWTVPAIALAAPPGVEPVMAPPSIFEDPVALEEAQRRKEEQEAARAGIGFQINQQARAAVVQGAPGSGLDPAMAALLAGMPTYPGPGGAEAGAQRVASRSERQLAFIEKDRSSARYLASALEEPVSPYIVAAGTVIPAALITGLNSDLPGHVSAQVSAHVFDSFSGRHILIPQGSRLIGTYDSDTMYGQSRALVVWTRLTMPNGHSIDLQGMPGVDLSGYAGMKDKVNNHWGKILGSVVLSSGIGATIKIVADADDESAGAAAMTGAAEALAQVGADLTQRAMQVKPTITVRPGSRFNVLVHKDIVLTPYRAASR